MSTNTKLADKPALQLVLIVGLCLVSVVIFSIIGGILAMLLYNFNLYNITDYTNENTIAGLKLFQLFSAIGLFVVPPIVYAFINDKKGFNFLQINNFSKPINYLLVIVLMIVSTPILSWLVEINANMVLPDFLHGLEVWMKQSEADATELTKVFLTFNGIASLLYVLVIIAVVPAIGEELLFRGIIQKIVISSTKNKHVGIWVAAFLFSALHMQFYGFLPRMLLGAAFGYLYVWSKSLWLPILGHFLNNGSVVLLTYFYPESIDNTDITSFADNNYKVLYYLLSVVLTALVLFYIYKINNPSAPSKNNTLAASKH